MFSDQGRYGRTLGRFHIGDTTAGQMLFNEGLAKVWEGRRAEWCG
jgi:endonuclease YncB( thermonuclease family)